MSTRDRSLWSREARKPSLHFSQKIAGVGERSVGDDVTKYEVKEWTCTVSKVFKAEDESEFREVSCGIGGGLRAQVTAKCWRDKKTKKVETNSAVLGLETKEPTASVLGVSVMLNCAKAN